MPDRPNINLISRTNETLQTQCLDKRDRNDSRKPYPSADKIPNEIYEYYLDGDIGVVYDATDPNHPEFFYYNHSDTKHRPMKKTISLSELLDFYHQHIYDNKLFYFDDHYNRKEPASA